MNKILRKSPGVPVSVPCIHQISRRCNYQTLEKSIKESHSMDFSITNHA